MLHSTSTRDKKFRNKKLEDWQWYEDPYKSQTGQGWYQEVLESHGGIVPAPTPRYGTEPPVHTGFRAFA